MTITIDLSPDVEQGLLVLAQEKGMSLADYAKFLMETQARQQHPLTSPKRTGKEITEAAEKIRGLLTDAEVDALFARDPSPGHPNGAISF